MKVLSRSKASPPQAPRSRWRVVLVEPDPYLAFLIRLHVPEAEVVEGDITRTADDLQTLAPDLVIVGVDTSHIALADVLRVVPRTKVLAIVDSTRASRSMIPSAVDGLLARPFVPGEVNGAIRGALGLSAPPETPASVGPTLQRARSLLGPARFAGVAIAAVLEVAGSQVSRPRSIILALAFVYATVRWLMRRPNAVGDAGDVAVAAALIAATGGESSGYMILGLVVCAGVGLQRGPKWGALAGLVVVCGSLPVIVPELGSGVVDVREAVVWSSLLPLLGLTGGFAARVWRFSHAEGLGVLAEANRVLSALYRIARTLPGGLEIGTVADAAVQEIRDTLRASAGAMLLSEGGTFRVVASFGLGSPGGVVAYEGLDGLGLAISRGDPIVRRETLREEIADAMGPQECWLAAQMKQDTLPIGVLLAACPSHTEHESNRLLLQQLAQEAAVAVENARLFSRVRELSIDEERQRLARELHDGVAQALTHLRYELEFMSRHGSRSPEGVESEIQRLSRVVERATSDVRSMILGLRSSVAAEGLVGSLRSYLTDLRGLGGPEIIFEGRDDGRVKPEVESELFRIAQEAVSNALRHAGATKVHVSIDTKSDKAVLIVEDDGQGIRVSRKTERKGTGVGLQAMRERADVIGAALVVEEPATGGTRVKVEYPGAAE